MKFVRLLKVLFTLVAVVAAGLLLWKFYQLYDEHPWTRDGQVRAYVIGIAARVDGPMTKVFVHDNQWVEYGDPLFEIDPTDYEKEVRRAQASLERTKTVAANLKLEVDRRQALVADELISLEEFQRFEAQYVEAVADIAVADAELDLAKLDLSYTRVNAPVSGYITNLEVAAGTYVETGQALMALVDSSSFWISAYFKETDLASIKPGDRVRIVMMGDLFEPYYGEVESIGWGIFRADGSLNADTQLPVISPTVDWVRLAQRFPVRIKPTDLPNDIQLRVGQTVSVLIEPLEDANPSVEPKSTNGFPKTLTDGRGAKVVIQQPPQRIISLAPSTTQWVQQLGAEARLIGVTRHCGLDESAPEVERYAVHPAPSFEAIVAAQPDLIITADIADREHVARLRQLGQTVLVLNNDQYDGIINDGRLLGEALGHSAEATRVLAELEAARTDVYNASARVGEGPAVLYALNPSLEYVAGPGSYPDDLLALIGATNVAGAADSLWPKLSREAIVQADPDIIVVAQSFEAGRDVALAKVNSALQSDSIWLGLSAVQNGRIVVVDSRLMNVPGPRVGEALRQLQQAIAEATQ